MKKTITALVLTIGAVCAAYAQNGVIKDLTGTVELKPAGTANFIAARAGDEIAPNTVVSTGFKSTATITVGSATIIARPLTRLTLTEIARVQETESINVNLQAGRVRIDVSPPSGTKADFKVVSPTATASVRGTSFELDTRNLWVTNGTVLYQGRMGAAVPVTAGSSSEVNTTTDHVLDPIAIHLSELLPSEPVSGPPTGDGTGSPMADAGGPSAPSADTGNSSLGFTVTVNP
jgi:hypothetical protein